MQASNPSLASQLLRWSHAYLDLTKPRVNALIVFCALIGMVLADKEKLPNWQTLVIACAGIGLVASAAAAFNCLLESHLDAKMRRTAWRPSAKGEIPTAFITICSLMIALLGLMLLWLLNALTMWLTLATFFGYSVIYTMWLKPSTPQNIVIGGLAGAMPPVLGWASINAEVSFEPWLLALIIFLWTPPHFWALALYRQEDYRASGLPMLPLTHGAGFTRLHILLYTFALFAASLLPYSLRMSGWIYLLIATISGLIFIAYAWRLYQRYSDQLAKRTFRYSVIYLSLLFLALLIDHFVQMLVR